MSTKLKKVLLVLLAAVLLVGVSQMQRAMNRDRERLGITRVEPLKNAPPVLAFTTVALGGFRGLISNALWMRATDLQDEDKFFEMAQLADWITKLEPTYVQVWLVQAWNMAYNISVKFKDWPDRWRWVKRGFELLRDDGLAYNPNEMLIYRELGWIFQHKMGQNLDDAHMYYKQQWANEMAAVFAKTKPNLDELINPQTDDQKSRAKLLVEKYKLDPAFMKEIDEKYGPLEWRLPESHAIYWGAKGLEAARKNPTKVKKDDLITLRRLIYQSMLMSFQRGTLVENPFAQAFEFIPNLEIIPKVSFAYEQAAEEDKENHDHILRAHRNFLRDAVYFLYEANRLKESEYWYKYLAVKYPDKPVLDDPKSLPATVSFEEYAIKKVQEDVRETDPKRVTSAIIGMIQHAYNELILGQDQRYAGYMLLARKVRDTYQSQIPESRKEPLDLPPFAELVRVARDQMLDVENPRLPYEARAVLRSKLGMEKEPSGPSAPTGGTNAVPRGTGPLAAGTNSVPGTKPITKSLP
jgi:hypothetical protein